MEWKTVFLSLAGLFVLYLAGSMLLKPLRWLIRVASWALVGVVLLVVINVIFGRAGFHIAINPVTVLTAGVLQVPGVLLLVLLNYFL